MFVIRNREDFRQYLNLMLANARQRRDLEKTVRGQSLEFGVIAGLKQAVDGLDDWEKCDPTPQLPTRPAKSCEHCEGTIPESAAANWYDAGVCGPVCFLHNILSGVGGTEMVLGRQAIDELTKEKPK